MRILVYEISVFLVQAFKIEESVNSEQAQSFT